MHCTGKSAIAGSRRADAQGFSSAPETRLQELFLSQLETSNGLRASLRIRPKKEGFEKGELAEDLLVPT